jgi:voltage-gated sodium channel
MIKKLEKILLNEVAIIWLIIINSILVILNGFQVINNSQLITLETFFIGLFSLEIFFSVKQYMTCSCSFRDGFSKFWDDHWNKFDFTIVVVSLVTFIIFTFFLKELNSPTFVILFRLIRLLRILSFIPNLDHIMKSLYKAIKTSMGIILIISFLFLIFGLINNTYYSDIEEFSDMTSSILALQKLIMGEGFELTEKIMESSNYPFLTLVWFSFQLLTLGIFGVAILVASITDVFTMDNNDYVVKQNNIIIDQNREIIQELKKRDLS